MNQIKRKEALKKIEKLREEIEDVSTGDTDDIFDELISNVEETYDRSEGNKLFKIKLDMKPQLIVANNIEHVKEKLHYFIEDFFSDIEERIDNRELTLTVKPIRNSKELREEFASEDETYVTPDENYLPFLGDGNISVGDYLNKSRKTK